jgi:hypothetical protein
MALSESSRTARKYHSSFVHVGDGIRNGTKRSDDGKCVYVCVCVCVCGRIKTCERRC